MYTSQEIWVNLLHRIWDYQGADVYADLLEPWLKEHGSERDWLRKFSEQTEQNWQTASSEDLCRLYAFSRVTDTLLMRLEPGKADSSMYAGPAITQADFQWFHEALGLETIPVTQFHPFYTEVAAASPGINFCVLSTPPVVQSLYWPCLMLGSLMYCRAGTAVSGSLNPAEAVEPCTSPLYWTSRRRNRACHDLSQGWGSRSQWRTCFRRDYRTPTGFAYHVDGKITLHPKDKSIDGHSTEFWIEMVRQRCLLEWSGTDSATNPELFPFDFRYDESLE